MTLVSVREAETRLASLIRAARQGEDVIIMEDDEPIARIVSVNGANPVQVRRRAGSGKSVFRMAPDFDAPLEDSCRTQTGMQRTNRRV
jgi:antitoxin (DNA-binding transcriptional repressor) of toxin-antitoxin stability system